MTLRFLCPGCKRLMTAPAELAGRRAKCPHGECGAVFVVPVASRAAAPNVRTAPEGIAVTQVSTKASSNTWYYQVMCQVFGPVTLAELTSLARAGRVSSRTLVREGLDGEWVPAHKIHGVLGAAGPLAVDQFNEEASDADATPTRGSSGSPSEAAVPEENGQIQESRWLPVSSILTGVFGILLSSMLFLDLDSGPLSGFLGWMRNLTPLERALDRVWTTVAAVVIMVLSALFIILGVSVAAIRLKEGVTGHSSSPRPSMDKGRSREGASPSLRACPNCGERVAPQSDGTCPRCRMRFCEWDGAGGRCPKCGFSHKFDGRYCSHCGFRASPRWRARVGNAVGAPDIVR